ncbi:hypothetical protein ABTJ36_09015 [Acinetobacter baumannii]
MRSEFNEAISEHNPLYKEGLSHDQFYKGAEWAWQHQQSKVDGLTKQRDSFIKAYEIEMDKSVELQKNNAWLSGVACRENKRANKLQEENVSTTTLLGKTIQEKNELQKRVDEQTRHIEMALLAVKDIHKSAIDEFHDWDVINEKAPKLCEHLQNLSVAVGELEQALKGDQLITQQTHTLTN